MSSKSEGFIGVFDSGVGGVSVLKSLTQILPKEDFRYFADSKNAPYGTKSHEKVLELVLRIADDFVSDGAKAIVVACNTATSVAIKTLRERYGIPVVGMEPAIKPALMLLSEDRAKKVGVLATDITLSQQKFSTLAKKLDKFDQIVKIPAPYLVDLVENHMAHGENITERVQNFISENIPSSVEVVVLGCTHFVFLRPLLSDRFKTIIDGNEGTARRLKELLKSESRLNGEDSPDGKIEFFSSKEGYAEISQKLYKGKFGEDR